MKTHRMACIFVAVGVSFVAALAEGSIGHPTTALNLRAKPRTTSKVLAVLQPHETVEIDQTRKGWYHVRVSSSGKTGWISRKFITLNEPPAGERAEAVDQPSESTYIPSTPMQHKVHHSTIRVHNAVIKAFEGFAQSLSADGIPFGRFGDEYDPPTRLVVLFGPGASIADLRAVVKATGPSPDLYLAAVGEDEFVNSIIVGMHGGDGHKSAKLKDVYEALEGAGDIDELANEIARKGKLQP